MGQKCCGHRSARVTFGASLWSEKCFSNLLVVFTRTDLAELLSPSSSGLVFFAGLGMERGNQAGEHTVLGVGVIAHSVKYL